MSLDQRSTIISEYRSKALVQEWFWHGTRHESVRLRLDSVERIIGGLFLFYVWTVQLGWNNIFQRTTEGDFPSGMASGGAPHGFLAWMSEWSQATETDHNFRRLAFIRWRLDSRVRLNLIRRYEIALSMARPCRKGNGGCMHRSVVTCIFSGTGRPYACHVVAHKNQQHTVDEKRKMTKLL